MNHQVPTEQVQTRLTAANKEAFVQARLINALKLLLLLVVLMALCGQIAYHFRAPESAAPLGSGSTPGDQPSARRVVTFAEELKILQPGPAPAAKPVAFVEGFRLVLKFIADYWTLLSFLAGLAIAAYIYIVFGIDYFESYRDVATKKMLAEFYRKLGDRMMIYGEWEPAEAAYRNALEINPTNIEASFGVAKAALFQPLKGQKFYAPDLVEAKLDFLIKHRPQDAQLVFLKGLNRFTQGDDETARRLLEEAIDIDPGFVGSHLQLGYMSMAAGEIEKAIAYLARALELDRSYFLTNNNLGYCYLITLQLDQAIKCLDSSRRLCPSLLNTISLGDAYRLAGQTPAALTWHQSAVRALGQKGVEKERYVGGQWLYNFMPLKKGDTQTIRQAVQIYTFEQKKMVALCALAFDLALSGDLTGASQNFGQALALDPAAEYRAFLANKIHSLLNLLPVDPPARAWFGEKLQLLSPAMKGPAG